MFGKNKNEAAAPQKRKGAALMSQMGMAGIEADLYGDLDNDEDLEAELRALSGQPEPPKPKHRGKGVVAGSEFDRMIADSMKDLDDEDVSDTEDPDLLAELNEIQEDGVGSPDLTPPPVSPVGGAGMVALLEDRMSNYRQAQDSARDAGDSSKLRRLDRGAKTVQDLLRKAKQGKPIDEEDIPTAVAITSTKRQPPPPVINKTAEPPPIFEPTIPSSVPEPRPLPAPRKPAPAPPAPRKSAPAPPAQMRQELPSTSTATASAPLSHEDKHKHDMLTGRREQYKHAALEAKKRGDMTTATKYAKIAKQFDHVVSALEAGNPIDLSQMPPPPPGCAAQSGSSSNTDQTKAPPQPKSQRLSNQGAGEEEPAVAPPPPSADEEKELFRAPDAPKTTMDALQQRLEKYRGAEAESKAKGEGSKARRMGRIVMQYQEAIRQCKTGKTVDFEGLPTPPGYAPIPSGPPPAAAVKPAHTPTHPAPAPITSPSASSLQAPAGRGQGQRTPSPQAQRSPVAAEATKSPQKPSPSNSQKSLNRSMSSRADQQVSFLKQRKQEFMRAALKAKKNNELELAKKYIRLAKGFDPMIDASESGLPVDLSQVPASPDTGDNDPNIVVVDKEDVELSGDRQEVFATLEQDLISQMGICATNSSHFSKLGDVVSANKFQKLETGLRKDLDALKNGLRHNDPVPKFHYENKTFSMVQCNTDLGENDVEMTVVRGIQYNLPAGYAEKDLDTYVKFEFPYPNDDPQVGHTETVKGTFNPEYQEPVKLTMNRKARALVRVIERKTIKLEICYKRGFLKSDKVLGTVNVKLLPLESQCTLHDSFDLTDGRKAVGGKLEVKVRIRDPFKSKQVEEVKEKWLVIDQFIKTLTTAKPKATAGDYKSTTAGATCMEVLKYERQQLDKQIAGLRASLSATQLSALTNKSQLLQEKIDQQLSLLKSGGLDAWKDYVRVVEKDIASYTQDGKHFAQHGDMQKAQLMLTKKKLADKEIAAIRQKIPTI